MASTISVIVPVYNVENYLRPTLDSIVGQVGDLSLQIILVDDGATDSSGDICDEYASRDPRIQVIHRPNGGLSTARNTGLDVATGDYIAFLDGDDWWELNTLQICSSYLDAHPEVEVVGIGIVEEFSDGSSVDYSSKTLVRMGHDEIVRHLTMGFSFLCGPTVWSKVWRRQVLSSMRFRDGKNFEDNIFSFEAMYPIKHYHVLPHGLIHYRRGRPGALSGISANMVALFDNIEYLMNKRPEDKVWQKHLNTMAVHYVWTYFYQTHAIPQVYEAFVPRVMPYVRRMRRRPYIPSSNSLVYRIKQKLFLHFPRLYVRLSKG